MTIDKEYEKKILESLDMLGENIKKSNKINGKNEALAAYKKAREYFK